jgi:hypothetical protein
MTLGRGASEDPCAVIWHLQRQSLAIVARRGEKRGVASCQELRLLAPQWQAARQVNEVTLAGVSAQMSAFTTRYPLVR